MTRNKHGFCHEFRRGKATNTIEIINYLSDIDILYWLCEQSMMLTTTTVVAVQCTLYSSQQQSLKLIFVNPSADHGGGTVVGHNRMTTAKPPQIVCKSYRRSWWRHWSWPQQDKINNSNKIVCETHHTLLAKKWNVAEIHYYACISVSPLHFLYFLTVQVSLLLLNLLWYAC